MTDDSSSGHSSPSAADAASSQGSGTGALEASRHRPSHAVITQLATVADRSPLELPPLHETIDVDALDGLFDGSSAGTRPTGPTVTFTHANHRIRLDGDGTITVMSVDEEPDAADDPDDDWDHVSPVRPSTGHDVASRLVRSIADATDHELPAVRTALTDVLDLKSLSRLNRSRANGVPRPGATVRFSTLGYDVVVAPDGSVAIGSTLHRLKRTGGNVLIVGVVPDALVDAISTTLLGGSDRRAVVALLDRKLDAVTDRLPPERASTTRVIDHAAIARSPAMQSRKSPATSVETATEIETTANGEATADAETESDATNAKRPTEPSAGESGFAVTAVTDDLEELAESIETTLVDVADDVEPGGLRLCVDSLRPILEECEDDDAVAFLERVGESVTRTKALAHYVLPLARESPPVRTIESAFDVTVELRVDETVARQRWHVHESAYATEWFPLSLAPPSPRDPDPEDER